MAGGDTNTYENMGMDHQQAIQTQAATRYLAGELNGPDAEAFEEHFFSCTECAKEVRDGDLFAETVREVFGEDARDQKQKPVAMIPVSGRKATSRPRWWIPAFAAAAACVFATAFLYDRLVVVPRMKYEIADLSRPQQPTRVTLKVARESPEPAQLSGGSPFWLVEFRLAEPNRYSSYICEIETREGKRIADVPLDPPPAGRPFTIQLRRSQFSSGSYIFRVRGRNETTPIDTYTIDLSSQ